MSRPATVLLVVYLVLAAAELVAAAARWRFVDTAALALLMPVLAGFVLTARRRRGRMTTLAVAALFFSWLGDTVGGLGLLIKIGLFLVAQLIFAAAFWPCRDRSVLRRPLVLAGYLICLAAAVVGVARISGALLPAVLAYGCALALMVVLASGVNRRTTLGGVLFVISDLSLSIGLFDSGALARALDPVVMPTYLAAQLLLVWGTVRAEPADPGGAVSAAGAVLDGSDDAVALDR